MEKKILRALFFMAFCLFFNAFSQDFASIPKGNSLSEDVYKSLSSNKFNTFSQELTPTGQDEFAKDIYIEFQKKDDSEILDGQRDTAVLDFRQEDFYLYKQEFLSFLKDLNSADLKCKVIVLFSALTEASVPPLSKISGSEVFAENLPSPDESFAVSASFDVSTKNTIHTGSIFSTSPLWLCKKITEAFQERDEIYLFPNFISSLYRLGLIHGDKRAEAFVRNEIPAISVTLNSIENLSVLKHFLESFTPEETENWDQHYVFLPLHYPAKPIVLNENFCLGVCMVLAVITLLSLCIISFTGKQGEQNKIELLKNLYVLPLTLAVSVLGLSLSQVFLKKFFGDIVINPVTFFGLKVIVSMIFISIFYALHNILKLPTDIFIYSYIIQFIAIFNIFFFALQDLMLFVPYGIEYILIFIFRRRKGLANLIIFFVMMSFPFIPYVVDILQKTSPEDFPRIIYTDFWGNISISLTLFPFQIIWLKILVRLNIFNKLKKYSALKLFRNGLFSTAAIFAFCFAFMQAIYLIVYKPVRTKEENSKVTLRNDFSSFCSVNISQDEFSGMNTNHIKITSEKNALRYEVKIKSLDYSVPIYDSLYAYDFSSEKTKRGGTMEEVNFIIPDYPPEKMTIDYAASPDSVAAVEVTSFYESDEKNVILRERTNAFVGLRN